MLSKIYLLLAFAMLAYFSISLSIQIKQNQRLNKDLKKFKANQSITPESSQVAFQLANTYFQKNMYNEAITQYAYCLEMWEKNDRLGITFILNRLVLTYSLLKEDKIALYYCKNALKVTPSSIQSLLNLNRLYDSTKWDE